MARLHADSESIGPQLRKQARFSSSRGTNLRYSSQGGVSQTDQVVVFPDPFKKLGGMRCNMQTRCDASASGRWAVGVAACGISPSRPLRALARNMPVAATMQLLMQCGQKEGRECQCLAAATRPRRSRFERTEALGAVCVVNDTMGTQIPNTSTRSQPYNKGNSPSHTTKRQFIVSFSGPRS
jgi:hypothetical protein